MDIVMPKMGESVSEGTIIKWHKNVGDSVKRDEIIFEISTDKVDTEIPAPADGVLSQIKANEGDTVEVGSVVAVIDQKGEGAKKDAAPENGKAEPEKPAARKEEPVAEENRTEPAPKETEKKSVPAAQESGKVIEITLPKMGESVMEGTIIKWHKKVGEQVKKDETIFEISTDKVDTEVPSPADGYLSEIMVGEQETVDVGTVVAKLSSSSAPAAKKKTEPRVQQADTKAEQKDEVAPEQQASMHDTIAKAAEPVAEQPEGNKEQAGFLSPLVLNIARKEKVSFDELSRIKGTGLGGRVTKKDILGYIDERNEGKTTNAQAAEYEPVKETPVPTVQRASAPSFSESQMTPVYSEGDVEKIPMDNIRQKIMQHMINSRDTSVHVAAMLEVDMTKVHNFIQKNKEEYIRTEGVKLTYMPFIAHACVKAIREFPLINSTIEGTTIIRKKYINLGIAVAIEPTGLIVPNIKGADERNVIGMAKAINDLASRARNRKLTPDDITNGTFTITNYGVFGTIFGTPIINQPEVAILGVGTVAKKPVVVETDDVDTIAIKPIMALTLSHDHRLVDGMLGGRFLKSIKDTLESFSEDTI